MSNDEKETGIQINIEDNRANIVLDMSSWDLFETCQTRYNYRHNLNKTEIEKSSSLDKGSVIHEGLDAYYTALKNEEHFDDRIQKALTASRATACSAESNLEPDDVNLIIRTLEENLSYWRHEDELFKILEVERAFAYELFADEHIRIIITGKIDLLVDYIDYAGAIRYAGLPIDHKTFSRDFETTRLTNQFQNYANAVNSNYLLVNKVGLQKTLKPEQKFKRVPLSYDPLILEDWKNNLISGITHEYLNCVATNRWRMNFTSCFKWNKKCEFFEVCDTSGAENKLYKLERNFNISSWDVTASFNK